MNASSSILRGQSLPALDVFGAQVTVMGGGQETFGHFSLAKIVCPPGAGAPPHWHPETEHFHVLRGRLTVMLEGESHELEAGDTVHIASGARHAFGNATDQEAEFIAIATPSGHEHFFQDADELARTGRFNPETAGAVCAKHRIELL